MLYGCVQLIYIILYTFLYYIHYIEPVSYKVAQNVHASGTQKYTNNCLHRTTIQKLSDAGLDTGEIMAISGHKCETALRSYWRPKLGHWRKWSNILATPSYTHKVIQLKLDSFSVIPQ